MPRALDSIDALRADNAVLRGLLAHERVPVGHEQDAALGEALRRAVDTVLAKVQTRGPDQPRTPAEYMLRWAEMYDSDTGRAIADALAAEEAAK